MFSSLIHSLSTLPSPEKKKDFLLQQKIIVDFLQKQQNFTKKIFPSFSLKEKLLLLLFICIGQEKFLLSLSTDMNKYKNLLKELQVVHHFYQSIGGILGYQEKILALIEEQKNIPPPLDTIFFSSPECIDIQNNTKEIQEWIAVGLESMPLLAEIYPVGGAGDRLGLIDGKTNEPLPVATLPFLGESLLARLIEDLQAREYLYYKRFNKQTLTPIILMTSEEKNNDAHIHSILEKNNWFSRPKEYFFFLKQPSVPVVTQEGEWIEKAPSELEIKPGGHGALWKIMQDQHAFSYLEKMRRKKALIRQINNPIAATDYGLLAFCGYGIQKKKDFGFASCPREVGSSEGMNILKEEKKHSTFSYAITNIEYTDFQKYHIQDLPREENSCFSLFPANTNILFADLESVKNVSISHPLPGIIVNMKNTHTYQVHGEEKQTPKGRLELTMQNIADNITDNKDSPITKKQQYSLRTFITYNQRKKTLSTTKRFFTQDSAKDTPESCFYNILCNHYDLLTEYCSLNLPSLPPEEEFCKKQPSFITFLHPALGPLYSEIAKKLQSGSITNQSELQLHLAEVSIIDLHLDGSLLVSANNPMGISDYQYNATKTPKLHLHNVSILNKGIDEKQNNIYWKNAIERKESLSIHLLGNAQFEAKNISFEGSYHIEVEDGCIMQAHQNQKTIHFTKKKITL